MNTFKTSVKLSKSTQYCKQCSVDLDVDYRIDLDIANILKPHHCYTITMVIDSHYIRPPVFVNLWPARSPGIRAGRLSIGKHSSHFRYLWLALTSSAWLSACLWLTPLLNPHYKKRPCVKSCQVSGTNKYEYKQWLYNNCICNWLSTLCLIFFLYKQNPTATSRKFSTKFSSIAEAILTLNISF